MSFFIKSKRGHDNVKVTQKTKKKNFNDEISSESEYDSGVDQVSSEDENETSQEKRLRLAKIYLQEIEKAEKERLEDQESFDPNAVSNRLREDYLKQTGKFRNTVADQYKSYDEDNLLFLKCKECKLPVTCLCLSADDKFIFSGSKDGVIVKWSISEKQKVKFVPFRKKNLSKVSTEIEGHSSCITCIAITNDFRFLAVGEQTNDIQIWNPDTLEHIKTLKGHKNHLTGLVFRKNTHQLYSCSKDKSVKIWSLDEMSYLETLFGHQDIISSIDALSRERIVTAGGIDCTLRIWKIVEESQLIFNSLGTIDCVKLINEENFVSGGDSGFINVWGSSKKKPICSIKEAHGCDKTNNKPNWICSVATLVNTDLIASGSNDGCIRLWKTERSFTSLKPLFTIPVNGFVNSLVFTSDGKYLIAGIGQEHRLGRWQTIKKCKNGILIISFCMHNKT